MNQPEEPAGSDDDEPPLVPRGNPLRWRSGLSICAAGLGLGLLTVMARGGPRGGVVFGFAAALLVAVGVLRWLGTFDDAASDPPLMANELLPPAALAGTGVLATYLGLRAAVAGELGPWGAGFVVTGGFLLALSGLGMAVDRLGQAPSRRPFYRREGFWLLCFATVVLLPRLGSHGLTDPWETHYGEVAREILARRDWISLWWAHEEWFWSKPILGFWMQALAMAALGVRYEPGEMLAAAQRGLTPAPEWAVRFPTFLVTIAATYVLYRGVAAHFGRRAGLLGGVVLTTMPQWFLLSHQTMTDMPFVAGISACLGFFLWALATDPEAVVRARRLAVGSFQVSVSLHQLLLAAVVLLVVPQIVYLVGRNVALNFDPVVGLRVPPVRWVEDTVSFGSGGGVCGSLPGNKPCSTLRASFPGFSPALQALLWAQALALFLYLEWGERRAQRLLFVAAFVCAALATLAKGPAGAVLPALAIVGFLVITRRADVLGRMEIAAGCAAFGAISLPWFVAMFGRHGPGFVDRLIFHDMVKRAFDHVHDTNQGSDVSFRYYLWQLGYATFPWVGLAPAAVLRFARSPREERASGAASLLVAWFVLTFVLFAYMQTKFHHYIFPAVPPLAMLVGVLLDRLWTPPRTHEGERDEAFVAATSIAGASLALLVLRDLALARPDQPSDARLFHLVSYNYAREWPDHVTFAGWFWAFGAAASVALLSLGWHRIRRAGVVAVAGVATLFAAFALNVYFPALSPHFGQRETTLAYVLASRSEPGPLVAYQMNWKGENFYTGNQVAAFVESGKGFRDWLQQRRKRGDKTFYLILLESRLGALQNELGEDATVERLTTPLENNKFALVRARFP